MSTASIPHCVLAKDAPSDGGCALVDAPDDDAPQLLAHVWIVSNYWAVYPSLQEGIDDLGPEHLDWG